MVFGEIGAEKSTYAKAMERDGYVRLSLDEWTIAATGDQVRVTAGLDGGHEILPVGGHGTARWRSTDLPSRWFCPR
jgi:hypothetical protein